MTPAMASERRTFIEHAIHWQAIAAIDARYAHSALQLGDLKTARYWQVEAYLSATCAQAALSSLIAETSEPKVVEHG